MWLSFYYLELHLHFIIFLHKNKSRLKKLISNQLLLFNRICNLRSGDHIFKNIISYVFLAFQLF
nr:MAG TPA: hypothetical protein [Caudoviricetes sp.]